MSLSAEQLQYLQKIDYEHAFANLTSLQVEISSACNLKCPQCFNNIPEHVTKIMSLDLWNNRIKPYLGQFGSVHLVGIGEPLMNKHFFTFVEDGRQAGVTVHTTSNLQLVTPEIAKRLVLSGVSELSFSCDGATKATYEAIRLQGTLEKLEAALASIVDAKANCGSLTPALTLNFGATLQNIKELPDVVQLAARFGVQTLIAYHNVAYVESQKGESLFHHQALSDEQFAKAAQLCGYFGIQFLSPGLFQHPNHYAPALPYCAYPFGHLYIYSDGRVGPCCMDFPDRIVLGNLQELDLPEVWNGEAMRKLRHELCSQPSETCRFCVSHLRMDITDPRYLFRFPGAGAYLDSLG